MTDIVPVAKFDTNAFLILPSTVMPELFSPTVSVACVAASETPAIPHSANAATRCFNRLMTFPS
jgi:hypothetical protein